MKPTDYRKYVSVYDFFSNQEVFPLLNDFIRLVNNTIRCKKKLKAEINVCDIGAGAGLLFQDDLGIGEPQTTFISRMDAL